MWCARNDFAVKSDFSMKEVAGTMEIHQDKLDWQCSIGKLLDFIRLAFIRLVCLVTADLLFYELPDCEY